MSIKECKRCGKLDISYKACSGCKIVFYCGKYCQKLHWKNHKQYCVEDAQSLKRKRVNVIPSRSIEFKNAFIDMVASSVKKGVIFCNICGSTEAEESTPLVRAGGLVLCQFCFKYQTS